MYVYSPCLGTPALPSAAFCAFRPTGALQWAVAPPPGPLPSTGVPTCAAAIDASSNVIVAYSNGAVASYAGTSGSLQWVSPVVNVSTSGTVLFSRVSASHQLFVFVVEASAAGGGTLYALYSETGDVAWSYPLYSSFAQPVSGPPYGNLFVVAAAPGGSEGRALELNLLNGSVVREGASTSWIPVTGTILDSFGRLIVGGSDRK